MKRVDLVKAIEAVGCVLSRHGAKHDWYTNPITGASPEKPRHREIGEGLARRIIRSLANLAGDDTTETDPSRET
jgi:mRNA interferase HicA